MPRHENWQLSDNAAVVYERYLVPALFTPWAHDLITRAAPQAGENILDVACGTGIVARLTAARTGPGPAGAVTGLDLNPDMLKQAHISAERDSVNVTWQQGDVAALPFDEHRFDLLLCQQSIQFFPDKLRALQEMHRVLKPGGRLALNVSRALQHNIYIRTLADALAHHLGADAGNSMRAPCALGDAEELRGLFEQAGFQDIRIRISILKIHHPAPADFIAGQLAATPVAASIAAMEESKRQALIDDVVTALRAYIDDDGLAVPYEIHVVTARHTS